MNKPVTAYTLWQDLEAFRSERCALLIQVRGEIMKTVSRMFNSLVNMSIYRPKNQDDAWQPLLLAAANGLNRYMEDHDLLFAAPVVDLLQAKAALTDGFGESVPVLTTLNGLPHAAISRFSDFLMAEGVLCDLWSTLVPLNTAYHRYKYQMQAFTTIYQMDRFNPLPDPKAQELTDQQAKATLLTIKSVLAAYGYDVFPVALFAEEQTLLVEEKKRLDRAL